MYICIYMYYMIHYKTLSFFSKEILQICLNNTERFNVYIEWLGEEKFVDRKFITNNVFLI